jgi:hypothetical protein
MAQLLLAWQPVVDNVLGGPRHALARAYIIILIYGNRNADSYGKNHTPIFPVLLSHSSWR